MASGTKKRWPIGVIVWLSLALLTFIFDQLVRSHSRLAEFYSRHVYGVLRIPFMYLHRVLPFSLTEFAAVLLILLLIPGLAFWLVRLFRQQKKGRFLKRSLSVLVILGSAGYILFMLFHGFNYSRQSLFESLDLPQREYSQDELFEVTAWLVGEVNASRQDVAVDEEGFFAWNDGEGTQEVFKRAHRSYDLISETTDLIHRHQSRPKPVVLSHWWSYTGITGMYFPIFVESNINRDISPDEMLFTVQHELAHAQGFAREDESNFWGYYAGTRHPDADYRYSAWLSTFVYFNNASFGADRDRWSLLYDTLDEGVKQDLGRRRQYWDQFKGPVREVSSQVNDTFLKVNRVPDGTKSYGRMMDLVMAEYYSNEH